jgi:hypothetical protein
MMINRVFKGGPLDGEVISIPHADRIFWTPEWLDGNMTFRNHQYSMGAGEIFHYVGVIPLYNHKKAPN